MRLEYTDLQLLDPRRASSHRSGENDVDFVGSLEAEEGELPDDLAGATGRVLSFSQL